MRSDSVYGISCDYAAHLFSMLEWKQIILFDKNTANVADVFIYFIRMYIHVAAFVSHLDLFISLLKIQAYHIITNVNTHKQ